ncbi:MAG: pilus assembly protein PilQ, partial [Gammaproteobacteria bacterium]
MAHHRTTVWRLLVITTIAVALSGCAADMDDLRTYIDEVKARPGGIIAPLPRVVPAPSFTYEAGDRRSP